VITFVNWGRIEPFPEHPDWMARGEACLARNQAAGAVEAYQTAAKLAPSDLGSWFGLGNGHFAAGQWREAVAAYDRALALDPAHALVHQNRARALDLAGDAALAAQGYRRALELAPGNAMAAGQFAMMLIRTGDLPGARALLARSRPAGEPAPQEEIALAWLHDADRRPADAEGIRARLRTRWGAQIEALFQELPSPPSTP
jgi:Flp pilus assembly protein TadD